MSWRPGKISREPGEDVDLLPELELGEDRQAELEDTVRNLKVLHARRDSAPARREEYSGYALQAMQNMSQELRELRSNQAKLLEALRHKASKSKQEAFEKALSEKIEKRLDRLRNIVLFAIAVFGALAGALKGR